MDVIVCGGRDFTDKAFVFETLDRLHRERRSFTRVRHGDAKGADYLAFEWACERGIPWKLFVAHWMIYNKVLDKAAGPKRNTRMLRWSGFPSFVIAFPGNDGTADMCLQAQAAGVEVIAIAPEITRKGGLIDLTAKRKERVRSEVDQMRGQGAKFFTDTRERRTRIGDSFGGWRGKRSN